MSHGLQVRNAAGELIFDSPSQFGGIFVEALVVPYGESGVKSYDQLDLQGRTLRYQWAVAGSHDFTTGSAAGVPYISWVGARWARVPTASAVLVFAE